MDRLKHYFPGNKCHQLLTDIKSVLLGIKPAFLVDYIKPDAEKLQLFIQDAQSQNVLPQEMVSHSNPLCILTINEDVLLVNMSMLKDHLQCKSITTQTPSSCCLPESKGLMVNHCVYVNVTKGLKQPELVSESDNCDLFAKIETHFSDWFGKLQSDIVTSHTPHSEQQLVPSKNDACTTTLYTSRVQKEPHFSFEKVPVISCDSSETTNSDGSELNVCTLFGRLLGYPVVYWFDPAVGYSLDMVELICYCVSISGEGVNYHSSSQFPQFKKVHTCTLQLKCTHTHTHTCAHTHTHTHARTHTHTYMRTQKEHTLYSFTVPTCLLPKLQHLLETWFHTIRTAANHIGLNVVLNTKCVCLPFVIL